MELTLNIYDDNGKVIKTYQTNTFTLKLKVTRNIMKIIDIDSLLAKSNDNISAGAELLKMMNKLEPHYFPMLKCVFPELTEEELDNCQITDVTSTIMQIINYIISNLFKIQDNTKN